MKYPDASLNTIANLMRLDIPVTDNNIKEFQMYGEFNGQIDNLLQDMETGFINGLTESTDNVEKIVSIEQLDVYGGWYGRIVKVT